MKVLIILLSLSFLWGCQPAEPETVDVSSEMAASEAEIEQQLMEADRAFDAVTAELGLDGWVQYFTDDAARVNLHGEIARGLEAIRRADAPVFADPAIDLRWEPTHAGVFTGGNIGYTKGSYRLIRTVEGAEETLGQGSYLSLWRREESGWKVILDTGAPKPPAASAD